MPVRSRDTATRDSNCFVSASMAVTGRDAAYEDPLIHCGAWPTRDRMPPRRVLLSESKASRRVAAKGCTAQCVDIDVGRAASAGGRD